MKSAFKFHAFDLFCLYINQAEERDAFSPEVLCEFNICTFKFEKKKGEGGIEQ